MKTILIAAIAIVLLGYSNHANAQGSVPAKSTHIIVSSQRRKAIILTQIDTAYLISKMPSLKRVFLANANGGNIKNNETADLIMNLMKK